MSIHYPGFQSLHFGFENCETADIRVSFIGGVQINNIKLSLGRFSQNQPIDYKKSCDSFMISVYRSYNEVHNYHDGWNHYVDLFERFKQNDIIDIKILLSNDKSETIYLPWSDNEYRNKFQTTITNKFNDLFIFISSNEKEFDGIKNDIDDESFIERIFSIKELEEYSKQFKK